MPVINEKTVNKEYLLPVASNFIRDDLPRLRETIEKIDADMEAVDQAIGALQQAGNNVIDGGTFS